MGRTVTRTGLVLDKRKWESATVKAGVLAGATYPAETIYPANGAKPYPDPRAGMPVAAIAAALHFGTRQRVARPFISVTVAEKKAFWTRGITTLLHSGATVEQALGEAGQAMKDAIKETIEMWPDDNTDEWAAVKGFNHGLIFRSHLLNSIDSEVNTGE